MLRPLNDGYLVNFISSKSHIDHLAINALTT